MLVKKFQLYLQLCLLFLFSRSHRRLSSEPGFTKSPLFLPSNKFPAIVKLECKLFLPSLSLHASFFSCHHLVSMQALFPAITQSLCKIYFLPSLSCIQAFIPAITQPPCKLFFLPSLSLHASFFSCHHLASMRAFFPAITQPPCKLFFLPSLSLHASFFSCHHLASMQAFFPPTFSLNTSFSAYPACFFPT